LPDALFGVVGTIDRSLEFPPKLLIRAACSGEILVRHPERLAYLQELVCLASIDHGPCRVGSF
jgi:hypothetical protein